MSSIKLNFAFPLRDQAALDRLIAQEAKTHPYLSRAQLYNRFSPPQPQVDAAQTWLQGNGFRITHVGADRLAITAAAPTANVEKALHVKINDYVRPGFTFDGSRSSRTSSTRTRPARPCPRASACRPSPA